MSFLPYGHRSMQSSQSSFSAGPRTWWWGFSHPGDRREEGERELRPAHDTFCL